MAVLRHLRQQLRWYRSVGKYQHDPDGRWRREYENNCALLKKYAKYL